jgi:hypothetical protein
MSEVPNSTTLDPTLTGVTPAEEWNYLGPQRDLDPIIDRYVQAPETLSEEERQAAFIEARRQSALDAAQNRVIVQSGGENYWASEHPNVFTFDDSIRGRYEEFHKDPAQRSADQQISGPGGESTHVLIETDDGHMFVIRRTNDRKSAKAQTFEISSTTKHMGVEGDELIRTPLDTAQLRGVVVRPNAPLVLGRDPESGRQLRTRGNVLRITTMQRTEEGKVAENHPHLQKTEKLRDAPARFLEAVKVARTMEAASDVGPLAIKAA